MAVIIGRLPVHQAGIGFFTMKSGQRGRENLAGTVVLLATISRRPIIIEQRDFPEFNAVAFGLGDSELLLKVARHKEVFFPAAWPRSTDARPGRLRLVPPDARLPELEQDYRKMQEMIFGEPPRFERLVEVLREIERHVNGA